MTREEAIEKLELMRQKVDEETYRALILAIKALEQEPCDTYAEGYLEGYYDGLEQKLEEPCDAISRQAVLDETIRKNSIWNSITNSEGKNLEEIIFGLPSVNPQPCKDAISREAVKELIKSGVSTDTYDDVEQVCKWIDALPSVTQKSKYWIDKDNKLYKMPDDIPQKSVIEDIKADLINEANEHMREGNYDDGVRFGLMLAEQIVCMHLGKAQKTGKWIKMPIGFKCSNCNELEDRTTKYCPNCGARMESEE